MRGSFVRERVDAADAGVPGRAGGASASPFALGGDLVPRSIAVARAGASLGLVALVVVLAALSAPAAQAASEEQAQEVAVLKTTVPIRSEPRMDATRTTYVAAKRPITGQRTTLPVLERHLAQDGRNWLKVRTPGRGTRRTGWIPAAVRIKDEVRWRIVIHRSKRRADAFYLGRYRRSFSVIVGKPRTPTPLGSFFVEENIREPPSHGIGPYAIALSARSGVYREFEGGPGQIALHGVGRLPGALGTAVSHGCVRFSNTAIAWLGRRIDAGTPVVVEP